MAIKKNPKYDLRLQWKKIFELSLIAALTFIIVAFKFYPNYEKEIFQNNTVITELTYEDVPKIIDEHIPPPPPKPLVPIEAAPDDDIIDLSNETLEPPIYTHNNLPIPPKAEVEQVEEIVEFIPTPEEMPEPIGGISAIQSKITYPELAKRAGVSGRVSVRAYIDEKGTVAKVELVKGIGAGCDEEALKAVSLTKFKPGKQRMKPVRTQVVVPVVFRLK